MGLSQKETGRPDRLSRWTIWIILAGALILRLIAITRRGLIYDDAFSIFLSRTSLPEIVSGTAADTMPPLYYFLLHFWMMFSGSIGFIRLLNVFLSLMTIGLVYLFATELFGKNAALWAAALAAVSPLQIYHAQDVRMYAL
ncbi:MAG: glycosyltransferase family 39 protein, partial [Anaerolineaceae bacterium]